MTAFNVDSLARHYSRVLLSKRVLRAFAIATLFGVGSLLLFVLVLVLTTDPAPSAAIASRRRAGLLMMFGIVAAGLALTVLYLYMLSRLAMGSRRAAAVLMAIIAAVLAVVVTGEVFALLQPAREFPLRSLALGAIFIDAITAWAMIVGPLELWRADTFTREVFREPQSITGVWAYMARLLDLPDVHAFRRSGNKRAWLLAGLALLLEGAAFHTLLTWSNLLGARAEQPAPAAADDPLMFAIVVLVALPGGLFLGFAMSSWLLRGARRLRLAARRACVAPADELLMADQRAPVLFLRSFTEDEVPLTAARVPRMLRGFDPGTEYGTLEEMIVHGLTCVGPVVAVANPFNYDAPVGAARWRVGDAEWQGFVASQIDRATFNVVAVGGTAGLQWEIDVLKRSAGALAKTIFILPLGTTQDAALLRRLAHALDFPVEGISHVKGSGSPDHVLAVALLPSGPTCFVSTDVTELSYYVAMRACIVTQRQIAHPTSD